MLRLVVFPLILLLSMYLSGCATYADLPAGTRIPVGEKPAGIREMVNAPLSQNLPFQPADYVIGANDVLYINVNSKPEFMVANNIPGHRVDGRGYISIPIAGEVQVGGLTISEARNRIFNVMKKFFNNPVVVVEIAEYRNRQVFVFGAVKKPGPVTIFPGGMNLAQAIATAELRDMGYDFRHIRIIRSLTPTQGELIVVDFDPVLRGKTVPIQLQEGDIVYVPKSSGGNWNEVIAEILPSLQAVSYMLQPFVNIKYLKK